MGNPFSIGFYGLIHHTHLLSLDAAAGSQNIYFLRYVQLHQIKGMAPSRMIFCAQENMEHSQKYERYYSDANGPEDMESFFFS